MPSGSSFFPSSRVAAPPRFSDLRREIRECFSDKRYFLAEEVYSAAKHTDKLRLAKALVDAWLAGYKAGDAKRYLYHCLVYISAELGADGLNEIQTYLYEKQESLEDRAPFTCLVNNQDLDFGDFVITRQGGVCVLVSLDKDDGGSFTIVSLAEIEALCVERRKRIATCSEKIEDFISTTFASEGIPLSGKEMVGLDITDIPEAVPIVLGR